jgi:hypothetical protein
MAQNEKELLNLKPQYEEYKKKEEECTKMWASSSVTIYLIKYGVGVLYAYRIDKLIHPDMRKMQYNSGCFKKSFTTLKAYINLFRKHVQCFELS